MTFVEDPYFHPDAQAIPQLGAEAERSILRPLLFGIPVVLSGLSYVAGGVQALTDLSFLFLAGFCLLFLARELWDFPEKQGMGGLLIFGGVLIWFCHDYFSNWFGVDFLDPAFGFSAGTIAKAAFYHCLFIEIMVAVYKFPVFRWAEKLIVIVPEPASSSLYAAVLLVMMAFTFSPFFLFQSEPFYMALWHTATFRSNLVPWTVGRTSIGQAMNLNYDWGGYVAQILQIGQMTGILAAAYSIMIARSLPGKIIGWPIWLFWVGYSFAGMRRGDFAFMGLPVAALLYYKYQSALIGQIRLSRWKAYALGGVVAFALLVGVQYEGSVRANTSSLELFTARGDTMFSEGLKAWAIFPDKKNYYYDDFPGETIVRPLPDTLFWLIIDPIPRALWNDKPLDSFGPWYSNLISGEHTGANGTTVSSGAVGTWYFRFGPFGVIEGALLYGWLMGVAERSLRRAGNRPLAVIFSLAFVTFMFRAYRDLWFHNLDQVLLTGVLLYVVVKLLGAAPSGENARVEGDASSAGMTTVAA
ncbi:MAG: O-antigen polymerase [Tepidisphaeraceae bacterium]|jgi:oligosaccharide repeat unit polymerase